MASQRIIHIGFPKTGSTFLQKYFSAHPEIYHNRQRFEHYVKTGFIDDRLISCDDGFAFDLLSEELLSIWPGDDSGLDSRSYNMNYDIKRKQKETAEGLKRLFPEAKVLIVVRGYQSLVSSLYSQYLFTGETGSFKEAQQIIQHSILEMYDYNHVIGIYKKLFGADNVLILPFEFLSDAPLQYLEHIEQFFGFQQFKFSPQKIHTSLNTHSALVVRCINFFALKYIRLVSKEHRKKKLLGYLEWLNNFKEKLNQTLKFGSEIVVDESQLRMEEFRLNSTLVRFGDKLEKYDSYYS